MIFSNKHEPKRLDKKVTFELPLSLVVMGSLVFGSGIFALSIFLMRGAFL